MVNPQDDAILNHELSLPPLPNQNLEHFYDPNLQND